MALHQYKKKRQFGKTPEPKGKIIKNASKPLTFMVHEHHASHLHFDLRLEMEGVLKSWAVPKGSSPQVGTKRLAVHVEDHPLAYGKFKGVIPEGNYGAGVVKIWDHGTYEALDAPDQSRKTNEKMLLAGLKKGHISFIAHGRKMKGAYDLVDMKGSKNWLLIKKAKHHTELNKTIPGKKLRIFNLPKTTTEKSASKSTDHPLHLPKIAPGTKFVHPMLATLVKEPFDRDNWIFEIKWDGYRAIADIKKKNVDLMSRHGLSFNDFFAPIVKSLKRIKKPMILDGEVVILDKNGRSDFQLIQNYCNTGVGNLVYYIFDILSYDGNDVRNKTLLDRKKLLAKVLPKLPNVKFTEHIKKGGKKFFQSAAKMGLEGIMAKNLNSIYQDGLRSQNWLKIKNLNQQEAVICGITQPRGSRKDFGALILGVYQKGVLTYVGHTGTGFNDKTLDEINKMVKPLIIKKSPFPTVPKTNMPVQWVKPKIVCEIRFSNWTTEGSMRQPVFLGIRPDKKAEEVIIEKPTTRTVSTTSKQTARTSPSESKSIKSGKPQSHEVTKHLQFTHLDKIYWPKQKITKGDLINYYDRIAPIILPYLKDRPESLHRYPNGIDGEDFFQKDFLNERTSKQLPRGLKTVPMYSEGEKKTVNYLLCQNKETLLLMANLGCIDINPWNSRYQKPDHPDYLIIDLDPLGVSFDKVVETALAAKKVLDRLKLPSFPKTSGATGMHICLPLGGLYTSDQATQFARILAFTIHQEIPSITSIERSPAKRNHHVYLDFLQNRQNQTIACAYSVRPKPYAPVSTPLKWSEVKKGLAPTDFTIKNIFQRLDKVGDLWKGVLGKGINMEKALRKLEADAKRKDKKNHDNCSV